MFKTAFCINFLGNIGKHCQAIFQMFNTVKALYSGQDGSPKNSTLINNKKIIITESK